MNIDDEVVYAIAITGINGLVAQSAIERKLPKHIGFAKAITMPDQITIPRLYTHWRGDDAEQAWQARLMEAVKEHGASIAIDVQPWSYAPGYPQGDVEL